MPLRYGSFRAITAIISCQMGIGGSNCRTRDNLVRPGHNHGLPRLDSFFFDSGLTTSRANTFSTPLRACVSGVGSFVITKRKFAAKSMASVSKTACATSAPESISSNACASRKHCLRRESHVCCTSTTRSRAKPGRVSRLHRNRGEKTPARKNSPLEMCKK